MSSNIGSPGGGNPQPYVRRSGPASAYNPPGGTGEQPAARRQVQSGQYRVQQGGTLSHVVADLRARHGRAVAGLSNQELLEAARQEAGIRDSRHLQAGTRLDSDRIINRAVSRRIDEATERGGLTGRYNDQEDLTRLFRPAAPSTAAPAPTTQESATARMRREARERVGMPPPPVINAQVIERRNRGTQETPAGVGQPIVPNLPPRNDGGVPIGRSGLVADPPPPPPAPASRVAAPAPNQPPPPPAPVPAPTRQASILSLFVGSAQAATLPQEQPPAPPAPAAAAPSLAAPAGASLPAPAATLPAAQLPVVPAAPAPPPSVGAPFVPPAPPRVPALAERPPAPPVGTAFDRESTPAAQVVVPLPRVNDPPPAPPGLGDRPDLAIRPGHRVGEAQVRFGRRATRIEGWDSPD